VIAVLLDQTSALFTSLGGDACLQEEWPKWYQIIL